jgi:predicted Zn finger-like uncharacterized protein
MIPLERFNQRARMELTCLNCTGTFEVDDSEVEATRGALRCPLCGREQTFTARGGRPIPEVEPSDVGGRREPVSEGFGAAFRKPMQAFGGRRPARSGGGPAVGNTGPVPEAPRIATAEMPPIDTIVPPPVSAPKRDSRVTEPPVLGDRPVELKVNPDVVEAADTKWIVKSPTGLVLEFPESSLLVNWSAVVENPAPYQVSRGGESWMSLEEFLRETKRGTRATQAFRRPPDIRGIGTIGGPSDAIPGGAHPAAREEPAKGSSGSAGSAPRASDTQPAQRNAVSTTAQFTFKIAKGTKQGLPRWAVALIVGGVLALLGGGAAAAFLFLK